MLRANARTINTALFWNRIRVDYPHDIINMLGTCHFDALWPAPHKAGGGNYVDVMSVRPDMPPED